MIQVCKYRFGSAGNARCFEVTFDTKDQVADLPVVDVREARLDIVGGKVLRAQRGT